MRTLFRLVFLLIVIVIAFGFGFYYGRRGVLPGGWRLGGFYSAPKLEGEARTEGTAIGRKLAEVGSEASELFSDAALTTKIKSKMGLDDHVEARNIHVSTSNGVVTLTGTVATASERARAAALARDTRGVKSVVDRIQVK